MSRVTVRFSVDAGPRTTAGITACRTRQKPSPAAGGLVRQDRCLSGLVAVSPSFPGQMSMSRVTVRVKDDAGPGTTAGIKACRTRQKPSPAAGGLVRRDRCLSGLVAVNPSFPGQMSMSRVTVRVKDDAGPGTTAGITACRTGQKPSPAAGGLVRRDRRLLGLVAVSPRFPRQMSMSRVTVRVKDDAGPRTTAGITACCTRQKSSPAAGGLVRRDRRLSGLVAVRSSFPGQMSVSRVTIRVSADAGAGTTAGIKACRTRQKSSPAADGLVRQDRCLSGPVAVSPSFPGQMSMSRVTVRVKDDAGPGTTAGIKACRTRQKPSPAAGGLVRRDRRLLGLVAVSPRFPRQMSMSRVTVRVKDDAGPRTTAGITACCTRQKSSPAAGGLVRRDRRLSGLVAVRSSFPGQMSVSRVTIRVSADAGAGTTAGIKACRTRQKSSPAADGLVRQDRCLSGPVAVSPSFPGQMSMSRVTVRVKDDAGPGTTAGIKACRTRQKPSPAAGGLVRRDRRLGLELG